MPDGSSPAIDIAGERFGSLVVISRHQSKVFVDCGAEWLCRCDCSATVVRLGTNLRSARARGESAACKSCRKTKNALFSEKRRDNLTQFLRQEWERNGSLYPVTDLDERPLYDGDLSGHDTDPSPPELYAMTHQQIADAFAADGDPVSREYVRQLEVSALAKCRRAFLRLGIAQP